MDIFSARKPVELHISIAPSLLSEWHVLFDILLTFSHLHLKEGRKIDTHIHTYTFPFRSEVKKEGQ